MQRKKSHIIKEKINLKVTNQKLDKKLKGTIEKVFVKPNTKVLKFHFPIIHQFYIHVNKLHYMNHQPNYRNKNLVHN